MIVVRFTGHGILPDLSFAVNGLNVIFLYSFFLVMPAPYGPPIVSAQFLLFLVGLGGDSEA